MCPFTCNMIFPKKKYDFSRIISKIDRIYLALSSSLFIFSIIGTLYGCLFLSKSRAIRLGRWRPRYTSFSPAASPNCLGEPVEGSSHNWKGRKTPPIQFILVDSVSLFAHLVCRYVWDDLFDKLAMVKVPVIRLPSEILGSFPASSS